MSASNYFYFRNIQVYIKRYPIYSDYYRRATSFCFWNAILSVNDARNGTFQCVIQRLCDDHDFELQDDLILFSARKILFVAL